VAGCQFAGCSFICCIAEAALPQIETLRGANFDPRNRNRRVASTLRFDGDRDFVLRLRHFRRARFNRLAIRTETAVALDFKCVGQWI
jgi:hypothetical protein